MKTALVTSFVAADNELIEPLLQWRYNGIAAGNGWTTLTNGAEWGTDYVNRTAVAVWNIYVNVPPEASTSTTTMTARARGSMAITCTRSRSQKDRCRRVKGYWSLTLYNDRHLLDPNPLKRYSLGTKNKTLQYNADGWLTLYAAGNVSSQRQENQNELVAGTCWDVLALHPGLLGGESHPRRHLDASDRRDRKLTTGRCVGSANRRLQRGPLKRRCPLLAQSGLSDGGPAMSAYRSHSGRPCPMEMRPNCPSHANGNPFSRSSSCSSAGCRPSRIASTISGASSVSRRTRLDTSKNPWC